VKQARWMTLSLLTLTGCPPVPGPIVRDSDSRKTPVFSSTVSAEVSPPPISGGTLLVLSDGARAAAADPDRDTVFVASLSGGGVRRVELARGDEPGRLVEDGRGRLHVALRGAGQVAVIDPTSGAVLARRPACVAPRGVAYDRETDVVHVACASGALLSMRAEDGEVTRRLDLGRDLRDVVALARGRLAVTKFRTAELIEINRDGAVLSRVTPRTRTHAGGAPPEPLPEPEPGSGSGAAPGGGAPGAASGGIASSTPEVAWRVAKARDGRLVMVHQSAKDRAARPSPGGYGSGFNECGFSSIVETNVSVFGGDGPSAGGSVLASIVPEASLAVDVAVSEGGAVALAVPGNARVPGAAQVVRTTLGRAGSEPLERCLHPGTINTSAPGQVTAVAFAGEQLIVQLRQPAALFFQDTGRVISLSSESRQDTGHEIFHSNSGGGLACASCHPEGDDDGRVWVFASIGPRRTQTFRGGLTGTEPFHWDGDMRTIGHLMTSVFSERMSGPNLSAPQVGSLQRWIDRLPAHAPVRTMDDSAARGRALFEDARVGCASCHGGPRGTNNQTLDVGTGAAFQVPSLRGIAWRAPFMHDGCAPTLRARFTDPQCGGGDRHGVTSHLSPAAINDLIAYLETL
jgi:hypothetical protein